MPDNFISGNEAYTKLGATSYTFNRWTLPIEGGVKKFFAFGSKFQRTTPGGISTQIVLEGPYNRGNMPLVLHAVYDVHLGFEAGVEMVVSARLANIEYGVAISQGGDPAGCKCTFESDGDFGINFT